jgi:ABC-2 type transport system permease protein
MAGAGQAQIFERGYRRYEGERLGQGAAIRAVWIQAFQRILGIRRPVWAKILPVLVVFLSYVPAIVFVGLVALTKNDPNVASSLPRYSDYYKNVLLAVLLLTAFGAPDALCPDRRTGMLGIYLSSPLTRDTYLLGKALAVFTSLLLVTTGPELLMLLANSLQGSGVGSAGETALMVLRIVGAGFAVSALFTSLAMAISSLTDRSGFATAAIILVLLASGAVGGVLSTSQPAFSMLDLGVNLPNAVTTRIFGVPAFEDTDQVATGLVYGAWLAWTAAFTVVVHVRYRLLRVTR